MRSARVAATGRAFPARVVPNSYFYEDLGLATNEEWIRSRTGIHTRHLAGPGETTSTLATAACQQALQRANVAPEDVDGVILATVTPDQHVPAAACRVQAALGAKGAFAWDVNGGCSGFLYALTQATALVQSGAADRLLVVGADVMSSVLDFTDRATCIIFGDGAGAFLIEAAEPGSPGELGRSILHSDGTGAELLAIPAGGSAQPASAATVAQGLHFVHQDGRAVFKHAVTRIAEVIQELLAVEGLGVDDIDLFVPHQANRRIIDAAQRRLKLDPSRVAITVDRWANTTAATLPTTLDAALEDGQLQRGQVVVFATFGAGFTWGASLLRW